LFLKDEKEDALFISERCTPMTGQAMLVRLHTLIKRTENTILIEKETGLHTLRHSIATHLLANGMKLEQIKDFLGHSSLESTQIYTHLLKENGYADEYAY
jgi:integrase/recombinase XerD